MNPYTGKRMPILSVPFSSNQITDPDVKRWITDNIPDFTQRLSTMEDFEQFEHEDGIEKVYLFSAKQKVPPIYKALSAKYRNRLRFAFVNVESQVSTQLAKNFEVEKFPTLLIQNSKADLDETEFHQIYNGKMKLDLITNFVDPYALSPENKKEDRVIDSKQQTAMDKSRDQSGLVAFKDSKQMEEKIINDEKAALVYVCKKDELKHI